MSRTRGGSPRRWAVPAVGVVSALLAVALAASPASAAPPASAASPKSAAVPGSVAALASTASSGDIGHEGPAYDGAGEQPTADKPQSKLWFNGGFWWADMFHAQSGTWHIYRLDRAAEKWIDTGTQIDDRPATRADALSDGTRLYVASNVTAASSSANVPNEPSRLYRYTYSAAQRRYSLDAGFPVNINNVSSESLTLAKDSRGVLWATWTQGKSVYVNSTNGNDAQWGTPFVPTVTGATGLSDDDISSISKFSPSRLGLLWSNQVTSAFYFVYHKDSDPRTRWTALPAFSSPNIADDHLNLSQLEGDPTGRVFAAVKTSLEVTGSTSDPQLLLLSLDTRNGTWSKAVFGTVDDCHTRPVLALDSTRRIVHMFATAPSSGGCPHTGTAGSIYEKTTSFDDLAFPPGRGTPVIRDAAAPEMNDVTVAKQSITPASGLVILASNDTTRRYWHADISPAAAPTPAPTPMPTPRPTPKVTVGFGGATFTGRSKPAALVTLAKPARTTAGNVLVATFTADNLPTVRPPAGWRAFAVLRPSGASLFGYYHVVTAADASTKSWTWRLSTPQKWSGSLARYVNVNTRQPFDSSITTARSTRSSVSLVVPSVTTRTAGTLVIGAVGADSGKITASPPLGWNEAGENRAGQLVETAYRATSRTGAQGATTWRVSGAVPLAAWTVALRPRT